jgi:hypothetical protein
VAGDAAVGGGKAGKLFAKAAGAWQGDQGILNHSRSFNFIFEWDRLKLRLIPGRSHWHWRKHHFRNEIGTQP